MCPARPISGSVATDVRSRSATTARVAGAGVGELVEVGAAVEQRDGDAVLEAELRLQPVGRRVVGGDLPRQRVDDELEALDRRDVAVASASAASIGGCVTPHEAKRLIPSPSTARPKPSSSAASPAASSHSPGPATRSNQPRSPSSTSSPAVRPCSASSAASTPARAASPAWSGFAIEPKFLRTPPACDAARPSAAPARSASSRSRRAPATAAATVPIVAVACQPSS